MAGLCPVKAIECKINPLWSSNPLRSVGAFSCDLSVSSPDFMDLSASSTVRVFFRAKYTVFGQIHGSYLVFSLVLFRNIKYSH